MLAVLLWQMKSPGGLLSLLPGGGASEPSGAGGSVASGRAPELRIEIIETADESAARHREILSTYGDDPVARAWVADCLAGAERREGEGTINDSWEYACWQGWVEQADSEGAMKSQAAETARGH